MRRREFIALTSAAAANLAVFARVAGAQQARMPRIAFVAFRDATDIPDFFAGLADFGYVDGRTAVITSFLALTNTPDDMAVAVAEAVASRPDIILVQGVAGALAAKSATSTIPVVFGNGTDPVDQGLVASLARPGGNLTGTTGGENLAGKRFSIAKEAIPTATRLVLLSHSATPAQALVTPQVEAAAKALGMELVIVDFVDNQDFTVQFDRVVAAAPQFAYVTSDPYFNAKGGLLADLQVKHRLPLITGIGSFAVLTYGPVAGRVSRRTGWYVDAILKGAKPGELPVEPPTTYDFVINLRTAKALGLTIPPSLLIQATEIIE